MVKDRYINIDNIILNVDQVAYIGDIYIEQSRADRPCYFSFTYYLKGVTLRYGFSRKVKSLKPNRTFFKEEVVYEKGKKEYAEIKAIRDLIISHLNVLS